MDSDSYLQGQRDMRLRAMALIRQGPTLDPELADRVMSLDAIASRLNRLDLSRGEVLEKLRSFGHTGISALDETDALGDSFTVILWDEAHHKTTIVEGPHLTLLDAFKSWMDHTCNGVRKTQFSPGSDFYAIVPDSAVGRVAPRG